MKIAFDHRVFSFQRYGGVSRYFTRLAENLLLLNQDIKIFASFYVNEYIQALPKQNIKGYKLNKCPEQIAHLLAYVDYFIARYGISTWKPHIVHETYYSGRVINKTNCPTVVTVHDMIHELFSDHFSTNDSTAIAKKVAVQRADHIICVSENTKRDLIDILAIPEHKISVIHLGIDLFPLAEGSNKVGEKPYLLYVGQRQGYKNFNGLLQAVVQSKRLKQDFDIVAFGGGNFTHEELSYISSLGFTSQQVRQFGGSDELLGLTYQQATAFVYPSLYEGFGIPPLEAMAHMCPVVSSNKSSMPEVIGDAGEFFDPLEVESIKTSIEKVVYDTSYSQLLVSKGAERIKSFSWKKCAESTLASYNKI